MTINDLHAQNAPFTREGSQVRSRRAHHFGSGFVASGRLTPASQRGQRIHSGQRQPTRYATSVFLREYPIEWGDCEVTDWLGLFVCHDGPSR